MKTITTIGIDLAKNSFSVYGVNDKGRTVVRRTLNRTGVLRFFANLPALWAWKRARHRNTGPERFALNCPRLSRTKKTGCRRSCAAACAHSMSRCAFSTNKSKNRKRFSSTSPGKEAKQLMRVPGIGFLTSTVLLSIPGIASHFKNGRQFASFLGLVPRQNSTGGKIRLLGISKRGDSYTRTLLIHGARAVLRSLTAEQEQPDKTKEWLAGIVARRGKNRTAVAPANKTARIVWRMLAQGTEYDNAHVPRVCHAACIPASC